MGPSVSVFPRHEGYVIDLSGPRVAAHGAIEGEAVADEAGEVVETDD